MDLSDDTISYLESKGTLEILSQIGSEGECRHFDLRHSVIVSSSTITNRLNKGVKLGLLNHTIVHIEANRTEKGYELTEKGHQIYGIIQDRGLPQKYKQRKELEEDISHSEDKVLQIIN